MMPITQGALRANVSVVPADDGVELFDELTKASFAFAGDATTLGDAEPELRELGLLELGLSASEVRDRQILARLRWIVSDAATHVPFYRQRAERYDSERIVRMDDVSTLPFLRKADLRANFPQGLVSDEVLVDEAIANGEIGFVTTSGTGSERTQALIDLREAMLSVPIARAWELPREKRSVRTAAFTTPICMGSLCHMPGSTFEDRLQDGGLLFFSSTNDLFSISDDQVREVAADWVRHAPDVVYFNPAYLLWLGRRFQALGIEPPATGVLVTSFQFCSRGQRRAIEALFGRTLVETYGASDGGMMGVMCARGRMHARDDRAFVEVVAPFWDGAMQDGVGAVAVTTLERYCAPLVRYLVGDLARLSSETCDCVVAAWPTIEVHGRVQESVVMARGLATTRQVDDAMAAVPGMDYYQLRQTGLQTAQLLVVPSPTERFDERAAREALQPFGLSSVSIEEVARLDPERSGKYATVKTSLPTPVLHA